MTDNALIIRLDAVDTVTPAKPAAASDLGRVLVSAALNKDIDAGKMEVLYNLYQSMEADKARAAFNSAMLRAQHDISKLSIVKDAKTDRAEIKFAKLEKISDAIRPIYEAHGFGLMWNSPFRPENDKNSIVVSCKCLHELGHAEPFEMTGALDAWGDKGTQNKTLIKGAGSSVSYLKRYLTLMIFNIQLKGEDTDAGGAATLTREQEMQILDLLKSCGLDGPEQKRNFLSRINAASVDKIWASAFPTVQNLLLQKLKQVEAAKAGK